jgi:glutamine amidotransferase
MIAIIDYGAGNLQSVKKALDSIGAPCEVTEDARKIERAAGVILPGVGAFGDAMEQMRRRGLVEVIRRAAGEKPFLGICLGLQLLFAASEESPGAAGLDLLPGSVAAIPRAPTPGGGRLKVPHMGWNSITPLRHDGVFQGVPDETYVYFVHSYFVRAADPADVAARAQYGVAIDAAVCRGLMTAAQFHPEKSGEAGLHMLRNFVRMTG